MTQPEDSRFRRALRQVHNRLVAAVLFFSVVGGLIGLHLHPDSPLPAEWNYTQPLQVSDPISPLTTWKLRRALATPEACLAALDGAATYEAMLPREDSEACHIRNRVTLRSVGDTGLSGVETSCSVALRTAMWAEHGLRPAAAELGTDIRDIIHIGSYNCRRMRTTGGSAGRWSTHATANALDVAGFRLGDGRRVMLLQDWDDAGDVGRFLRAARDSACNWFSTTLGPDFNRLHADHFHLQHTGWGTCR